MFQSVGMNGMMSTSMDITAQQGPEGQKLTDEQKEILEEIISRYDPENFSDEDEKAMRTELSEAGIMPSRELGQALENAGFDVRKPPPPMEGQGGPGGPGGPPPGGAAGAEMTDAQKEILEEILSSYDPDNFSTEDEESLRTELMEAGIFPGQELGQALKNAGFEMSKPPRGGIPNGIILDDTV